MEEHPQARQIVETLAKAGFVAYYAGGWVRDFLLNHPSDDIDIATNREHRAAVLADEIGDRLVEFSTAAEDAKRRDFTINGMFYDPLKEELLDFVHGRQDLEAKIIRAIGNPHERIKEDRLRMIRANSFRLSPSSGSARNSAKGSLSASSDPCSSLSMNMACSPRFSRP